MRLLPARYRHLFFDLDHTLWDFDRNAADTLRALFDDHDFGRFFSPEQFIVTYTRINHAAWRRFHLGEITVAELRGNRFQDTFRALGADPALVPPGFGEAFIQKCSTRTATLPHAHAVLTALAARGYTMHILTNGFRDSQRRKLEASDLARFFTEVITTDCSGTSKPAAAMFTHALERASTTPADSLMIGDSLEADVLGALAIGMDAVYFNPARERHYVTVTHEITDLRELLDVL